MQLFFIPSTLIPATSLFPKKARVRSSLSSLGKADTFIRFGHAEPEWAPSGIPKFRYPDHATEISRWIFDDLITEKPKALSSASKITNYLQRQVRNVWSFGDVEEGLEQLIEMHEIKWDADRQAFLVIKTNTADIQFFPISVDEFMALKPEKRYGENKVLNTSCWIAQTLLSPLYKQQMIPGRRLPTESDLVKYLSEFPREYKLDIDEARQILKDLEVKKIIAQDSAGYQLKSNNYNLFRKYPMLVHQFQVLPLMNEKSELYLPEQKIALWMRNILCKRKKGQVLPLAGDMLIYLKQLKGYENISIEVIIAVYELLMDSGIIQWDRDLSHYPILVNAHKDIRDTIQQRHVKGLKRDKHSKPEILQLPDLSIERWFKNKAMNIAYWLALAIQQVPDHIVLLPTYTILNSHIQSHLSPSVKPVGRETIAEALNYLAGENIRMILFTVSTRPPRILNRYRGQDLKKVFPVQDGPDTILTQPITAEELFPKKPKSYYPSSDEKTVSRTLGEAIQTGHFEKYRRLPTLDEMASRLTQTGLPISRVSVLKAVDPLIKIGMIERPTERMLSIDNSQAEFIHLLPIDLLLKN